MNRIINGRKYDTATAKEIYEYREEDGNYTIVLYRKRTGEFFLHHWTIWNGDEIEPITEEVAKDWLEDKVDSAFYETVFGPAEE